MKKNFDKIITVVICLIVIAFCVGMVATPEKDFSPMENRTLTVKPKLTSKNLISGKYTADLGKYLADQFPFRDGFVSAKAYFELLQGKGENNGVIYAKGGLLIPKAEADSSLMEENLRSIKVFKSNIEKDVLVAALPRTIDVFEELLPKGYPKEETRKIWAEYTALTKELDINSVNVYDLLCDSNAYYSTDHHYTSEGAYLTYRQLQNELNYTPKEKDFFKIEKVADDFCGTAMRTSGFYLTQRDSIELYRYEGDTEYTVIADEKQISLYDMGKLVSADKYGVFLGGNHARVDITAKGKARPRLLIVRDSFADSLVPFLAIHYDITLIDLRYFKSSVAQLVKSGGYDKVLVLLNISELATSKNLSYLQMP
ncbi:MAG: hypothetical protein IKK77_00890 [Clostridia bacterium]|nr:hypothetical protein [Clostridia bacterium]